MSYYNLVELVKCYSEPHRAYHNWNHISQMLTVANDLEIKLNDAQMIALLGHDIIYDPGSHDNEERSADKILSLCGCGVPARFKELVRYIIMATKFHIPVEKAKGLDLPIIDLDLSILASPRPEYDKYIELIRKEYSAFETNLLIGMRIGFLEAMLDRDKLFYTPVCHYSLETIACENMSAELINLRRELC